jgi:DNA repair exonuclease SbcCD ATPase subunit
VRLLRAEVENFACIRNAAVDFGPGLNVLFGPNDLGKSTFGKAIRAALLMQHTSASAEAFVEWDSGESPSVKLTIELPDRRIWRIEKRFGINGSSMLRESMDGVSFSPYKRAREVDEELRVTLGWGVASPASKGAPRGLPTSFLATVLLGEQTDVGGVLKQTLEADTDESGRARLTHALAAFAQEPLFKRILDEAQGQVDVAFTSTGSRKRGKTSPFRDVTDEVKRAKEEMERLARRVDESENVRRELEARNHELLGLREARDHAIDVRDASRNARRDAEARRSVAVELKAARDALAAQEGELAELHARELKLAETVGLVEQAKTEKARLETEKGDLIDQQRVCDDALRRANSDEAEQARQRRRSDLEKRVIELDSEAKSIGVEAERVARARRLHTELERTNQRLTQLAVERTKQDAAVQAGVDARQEYERASLVADLAARVLERGRVQASIEELEIVRDDVVADRAKADGHRARARALAERIPAGLPTPAAIESMQELRHKLDVAEARLGGGLAVVVTRLGAVELTADADGSAIELAPDGTVSFEAVRGFSLQIGDVARVSATAGERSAREDAALLRARWTAEVAPILFRLGVPDLIALASRVGDASTLRRDADEAESAARTLDGLAKLREERLSKLADLREEAAALDRELERQGLEPAQLLLEGLGSTSVDTHRAEVRRKHAASQDSYEQAQRLVAAADSEQKVLAERAATASSSLEELGLIQAADWQPIETELVRRSRNIENERQRVEYDLGRLVAERAASVEQAESALAAAMVQVGAVESKLAASNAALDGLRGQINRLEGEIENRRAAAAKIDVEAARGIVEEISRRIDALPAPARTATDDDLRDADRRVEEAERSHDQANDAVRKAEGALQTVGGQVVLEQRDAAREAVRQAEQKERDVEIEYDAWRLLTEKLREAENTEGTHLGEALSQPVTERFTKLTAGRYGKLEVAPNLHTEGLRVAGKLRELGALSVGTQEQLATLLRLTIAEQLRSMLLLDDHLTQTDAARSEWFREILREHASKAQVIVLTCRPQDYLRREDLPAEGEVTASRAAGIVRATDMSRVIVRGDDASPRVVSR